MRIGIDLSQTCLQRTGCAWYADRLVRTMASVAPEHDYILLHRFDLQHDLDPSKGTRLSGDRIHMPYGELNPSESALLWEEIRNGRPIEHEPEIVQCNSFQAPNLPGTNLIYTIYDVSFWIVPEYTSEANRLYCQAGTLQALQNAKGLLFISQSSLSEFEEVFPDWLSDTGIPHAVTPLGDRELTPHPSGGLETRESGTFWLTVNAIEPRKNLSTLLNALEIYWKKSAAPKRLKLAGMGTHQDESTQRRIRELASHGMVEDQGYVSEAHLSHLYSHAAGFIYPSWYEGFGLPILEAMAVGCPVISSDRTSLPEVGGDAVLYINPESADSIAEAMLRIEGDPALAGTLSDMGKKQAEKFSWENTARLTLDFYEKILSRS